MVTLALVNAAGTLGSVIDMAREPEHLSQMRRVLGEQLAALRQAAGLSQGDLAKVAFRDRTTINHIEKGRARADQRFWQACDEAVAADGVLLAAFGDLEDAKHAHEQRLDTARRTAAKARIEHFQSLSAPLTSPTQPSGVPPVAADDDEQDALELVRRINASDVGNETLESLEAIVDELAIAYPRASPHILLERIRRHLGYVTRLLDARKTLAEHHRLLVVGGWLSLSLFHPAATS